MKIVRSGSEGAKRPDSKDSGSIKVIMAGMGSAFFLAFPLAFVKAWSFSASWQVPFFVVGLLMLLFGSLLRRYCWRTLGEYFTGDVKANAGQPVINTGPYRLVRHPSYTAGTIMMIGVGAALGSWASLTLITIGAITTYGYRVAVEERALLDAIGEPYKEFMKTRKRFIPYII